MTSWLREQLRPKPSSNGHTPPAGDAPENVIPIGQFARDFLEHGAPCGDQRDSACRVARNLTASGISVDDAADMIFRALDERSPFDPRKGRWMWQEVWDLVDDIARKPAPPLPLFDQVEVVLDAPPLTEEPAKEYETADDAYVLQFAQFDLTVRVNRVSFEREIMGWMSVERAGESIGEKRADFSSPNGFNAAVRWLASRDTKIPWPAVMDRVADYVLAAVRTGAPPIILNTVELPQRPQYRVDPLILEGCPNLLFGMGGSGKSLTLYYLGLLIASGTASAGLTVQPGNVLLLDWELDEGRVMPIVRALAAGLNLPKERWPIHYKRSSGTLTEEAEDIGRYIRSNSIDVVLIDSLGKASGGDKNSQEVVQRMFGAMRRWPSDITTIALDHTAKPQNGRRAETPYGSVYTLNDVRSAFLVEGSQDNGSNDLYVTLRQRKRNFGPVEDIGLRFTFSPDAQDPTDITVTRDKRMLGTAVQRITAALTFTPDAWMTVAEIATVTGMAEAPTATRLHEMETRREAKHRKREGENRSEWHIT